MTPSQLALVHVAKKKLGLDDDTYRALLKKLCGVESVKDLDAAGFKTVMEYFSARGFESNCRARNYGDRAGMASAHQVNLIRNLWKEYIGAGDEAALNKWLERTVKTSTLRFLTAKAAQDAITGLRKMIARQPRASRGGANSLNPAA